MHDCVCTLYINGGATLVKHCRKPDKGKRHSNEKEKERFSFYGFTFFGIDNCMKVIDQAGWVIL
ncbi:hypothetical protein TSUD_22050 [Trifolium subterraneum]|uniref:Uncharacterized protein n=1 Tax=Trifolium subterraneum TaxID=3900 RepID=A0A2Z6NJA2_TRISU|nr:hypothetical protein TSUD_22050 [Trifolium subterraneum]